MTAALVEIARRGPGVQAHTLGEENASTRVLARLGFRLHGPVDDPEEGTVWRRALDLGPRAAG